MEMDVEGGTDYCFFSEGTQFVCFGCNGAFVWVQSRTRLGAIQCEIRFLEVFFFSIPVLWV